MNAMTPLAAIAAANPKHVPWTDPAVVAALDNLSDAGQSFGEIAAFMAHTFGQPITRGMVSGAIHRSRIARKLPTDTGRRRGAPDPGFVKAAAERRQRAAVVRPRPRPAPRVADTIAVAEARIAAGSEKMLRLTLMQLKDFHCRFPLDRNEHGLTTFCGCRKRNFGAKLTSPYCDAHTRVAWTLERSERGELVGSIGTVRDRREHEVALDELFRAAP